MLTYRFVKDIIGRMLTIHCEVCDLANHKIMAPCGAIYEDDEIVIYSHLYVPLLGYIVIAPKQHVDYFDDLDKTVSEKLDNYANKVVEELKKLAVSDEFSIIKREDEHCRIWVMPRLNGIFENDFDFRLLENKASMKRRKIPIAEPSEILLITKRLNTIFRPKYE